MWMLQQWTPAHTHTQRTHTHTHWTCECFLRLKGQRKCMEVFELLSLCSAAFREVGEVGAASTVESEKNTQANGIRRKSWKSENTHMIRLQNKFKYLCPWFNQQTNHRAHKQALRCRGVGGWKFFELPQINSGWFHCCIYNIVVRSSKKHVFVQDPQLNNKRPSVNCVVFKCEKEKTSAVKFKKYHIF